MGLWDIVDFIPVVGTIKKTAECIACAADGDVEGALCNGAQALVGGVLDVVTVGVGGTIAKATLKGVAKETGKLAAKEAAAHLVTGVVAVNVLGRGCLGRGQAPRQSYQRSRKTSEDNEDSRDTYRTEISWQEIYRQRYERKKPEKPGREKSPSRRGEHIINNSVLNIYRDIARRFVGEVLHKDWQELENELSEDSSVLRNIRDPVPPPIRELIGNILVVHAEHSFFDNNAEAFGRMVERLRNAAVAYMERLYILPDPPGLTEMEIYMSEVVEEFIAGDYFVDENVLRIWLKKGGNRDLFEKVRRQVQSMLRALVPHKGNNMLADWVLELKKALEKLKK